MTLYGEPRVWLEQFPPGEPTPFSHDYLGIRYPGEVVRADNWSSHWGNPLEGEVYFRVVLLNQRRGGLRPAIQDPRVAVCLPAAGLSRRRSRLAVEVSTTRETQAVYLTQRDTEADLIRQTLRRRLEGLEEQLLGEDSVRYCEGQVITGRERQPDPASVFVGLEPATWFSRVAEWLLAEAYPALPLDAAALPRPVTGGDAPGLFRGIFGQPEASTGILEQLGPALGLSDSDMPGVFDPSSCRVLELVRSWLSENSGTAQWTELHRYLSHQVGLTGPLATLYLLLCIHGQRPEQVLELVPGHQIKLVDDRPLLGNRITTDLIPAIAWDERIAEWAQTIGPPADPQWNDALQHLSTLSPGVAAVDAGSDFRSQEQALMKDMGTLTQELAQARDLLDLLDREQNLLGQIGRATEGGTETLNIDEVQGRLSRISGDGFRSVYHSVRSVYSDYRHLESDLPLLRQMAGLGRFTEDILRAQEYLEGAVTPEERFPALSVDRQALRAALSSASLVESRGRNWNALVQDISRFKARFSAAYRTHHESVHGGLALYRRDLESAQRKVVALDLLNTMPELGEATGEGLGGALAELGPVLPACFVAPPNLLLDSIPWCDSCRLSLAQSLPTARLAGLLASIDVELSAKSRELSNLLVERIIQGQEDERLDDFLKIVQASDLSALSNTITTELVAFIRRMLG